MYSDHVRSSIGESAAEPRRQEPGAAAECDRICESESVVSKIVLISVGLVCLWMRIEQHSGVLEWWGMG
jgi:hypothetical protein